MENIREMTVGEFIEIAGSKKPTPGGGAIAALGGALGVSMGLMAARFTTGKKKFADVAPEINQAIEKLEGISRSLLDLVDADREAYSVVSKAYSMPKETDEDKAARREAIREACIQAAVPPENALNAALAGLRVNSRLAAIANPMLLSDVGVAVQFLQAAAASAYLNVEVNARSVKGEEGEDMLMRARARLDECMAIAAETLALLGTEGV